MACGRPGCRRSSEQCRAGGTRRPVLSRTLDSPRSREISPHSRAIRHQAAAFHFAVPLFRFFADSREIAHGRSLTGDRGVSQEHVQRGCLLRRALRPVGDEAGECRVLHTTGARHPPTPHHPPPSLTAPSSGHLPASSAPTSSPRPRRGCVGRRSNRSWRRQAGAASRRPKGTRRG